MITAPLLHAITAGYRLELDGVHGLAHWARVLENGRRLATVTRADRRVVELFAVLHDSCRVSEITDPDHGRRGADLARELRGDLFQLDDHAFDLLTYACETHTDGIREGDLTVCTCWDADRLDLGRCLIEPDPERLSTAAARDPALLAWADGRAHNFVVPKLVETVWRPMLRQGEGGGSGDR